MARGRPRLTKEEKQARKATRDASKAINDWDARLPTEPERRDELFRELHAKEDRVSEAAKEIRNEEHVAGQVKRMTSVFGLRKATIAIDRVMRKLSPEEQTEVWRQVQVRASDAKWGSAPGLFDVTTIGKTAPEEGSIFDKTASGERQSAERGDDPAKAGKRKARSGPPPAPASDATPLEEAERAFTANANRAPVPTQAEEDEDLRPHFMRRAKDPLAGAEGSGTYKLNS